MVGRDDWPEKPSRSIRDNTGAERDDDLGEYDSSRDVLIVAYTLPRYGSPLKSTVRLRVAVGAGQNVQQLQRRAGEFVIEAGEGPRVARRGDKVLRSVGFAVLGDLEMRMGPSASWSTAHRGKGITCWRMT